MRPTLSPSARVSELPPVEVRLAALLNSPGKGGGGAGAAGTGGSALRSANWPAARDSAEASAAWAGRGRSGHGRLGCDIGQRSRGAGLRGCVGSLGRQRFGRRGGRGGFGFGRRR